MNSAVLLISEMAVILGVPYAIWHYGQFRAYVPCVVLQILLGIALGPSCLGRFAPEIQAYFFNVSNLSQISGVASISIVLFAFLTGLHLDNRNNLRGGDQTVSQVVFVGLSSVFVPLLLGGLVGSWIYSSTSSDIGPNANLPRFALAIGIAVSVTALPVLSAILREMRQLQTELGQSALRLAAINDAVLWIMVSVLLAQAGPTEKLASSFIVILALSVSYAGVMFIFVKPLLKRIFAKVSGKEFSDPALIAICVVALISALFTELIGLHYLLGAFVAGAITPEELRKPILARIETTVVVLLTPFFFTITGLRTTIDFSSPSFIQIFILSTVAAMIGKIAGTAIPMRLIGRSWRQGLTLGALMQTKGLMELIVLTVLFDAGLIGKNVFSALVLVAIVTTSIAMPMAGYGLRSRIKRSELSVDAIADIAREGAHHTS